MCLNGDTVESFVNVVAFRKAGWGVAACQGKIMFQRSFIVSSVFVEGLPACVDVLSSLNSRNCSSYRL